MDYREIYENPVRFFGQDQLINKEGRELELRFQHAAGKQADISLLAQYTLLTPPINFYKKVSAR